MMDRVSSDQLSCLARNGGEWFCSCGYIEADAKRRTARTAIHALGKAKEISAFFLSERFWR